MSLRVAFYSHNGFGLGHVRRNLKLAQALLRARPNADVLLITGSAGFHRFPLPAHVDYVKLPSVRKQATGRWRPQALDIEMERLLALRTTMVLEAVRAYRPHLFVADFLPQGVEGELVPALEVLSARSDARTAVGFRDILDDPETVRATWALDNTARTLEELYDAVLVYGEPDWFDFSAYGLGADDVRYVGLLGDADAARDARPGDEIRLVATCGGGVDGYAVLAAVLEALPGLRDRHPGRRVGCLALAGPLMAEPDFSRLRMVAKRTGGRVRRFADDFPAKLARASVVVGMAGYNTVCDVLSHRRHAVLVPREGPSREQPIRADILSRRALAANVPLGECTPQVLVAALEPQLAASNYPADALPELRGAERAAAALLELLE